MKKAPHKIVRIYCNVMGILSIIAIPLLIWLVLSERPESFRNSSIELYDMKAAEGMHVDLQTFLNRVGPPDGYRGDVDKDLHLLYRLNDSGKKRIAYVCFRSRFLLRVGCNIEGANDDSSFQPWDVSEDEVKIGSPWESNAGVPTHAPVK